MYRCPAENCCWKGDSPTALAACHDLFNPTAQMRQAEGTRIANLSFPRHTQRQEIVHFLQRVQEIMFFLLSATLTATISASHELDKILSLQLNSRRDSCCASSQLCKSAGLSPGSSLRACSVLSVCSWLVSQPGHLLRQTLCLLIPVLYLGFY